VILVNICKAQIVLTFFAKQFGMIRNVENR